MSKTSNMKYIRTKDVIRKIVGENHILKSVSYYKTPGHLCSYRTETNRYKIANTIEELCDEFVCFKGEERRIISPRYSVAKECYRRKWIIYGAILKYRRLYESKTNQL